MQSIKEGVARVKPSRQELWEMATHIIKNARESTNLLMKKGAYSASPKVYLRKTCLLGVLGAPTSPSLCFVYSSQVYNIVIIKYRGKYLGHV